MLAHPSEGVTSDKTKSAQRKRELPSEQQRTPESKRPRCSDGGHASSCLVESTTHADGSEGKLTGSLQTESVSDVDDRTVMVDLTGDGVVEVETSVFNLAACRNTSKSMPAIRRQ